jgi:hypothetical protein
MPSLAGLENWTMETIYRARPIIIRQSPIIPKNPFRYIFRKKGIIMSSKVVITFILYADFSMPLVGGKNAALL